MRTEPEGIKRAVRAGVRSIEHGSLADDEALQLMKEHGTWLVADIWNGDYIDSVGTRDHWSEEILRKNRETTETQRVAFRKAVALGVHIAYGTDSGVYPHGLNAAPAPVHGEVRDDPDAGDPVRDHRRGQDDVLGCAGGLAGAGEVRRSDRGKGRCDGRPAAVSATVPFVMKGGQIVKQDGKPSH